MTRTPDPDPRTLPEGPVLLVRPSALGDVARTIGCLVALDHAYPGRRIDWLVNAAFADAVRHHPALGRVVPFDRRNRAAFFTLLRRLRRERYAAVYDLQGLARSGAFTLATAAPRRVGFADAREFGWLGYTERHRVTAVHTVDRMHGLLAASGIPTPDHQPNLRLHVGFDDAAWLDDQLARRGLTRARIVALAPTAQWGCKCWPISRYAELSRRLLDADLADHIALVAAPHEHPRIVAAVKALHHSHLECLWLPVTTVGQSMALIRHARLLVGNDSAPLHLAVGLDTPTVSLFGPTDPARVGPYHWTRQPELHTVLRPDSAAGVTFNYRRHRDDDTLIAELSVDDVWPAVRDALTRQPHP